MTDKDTMKPDEKEVIEEWMDQLDEGNRSTFEEVMEQLGININDTPE